MGVLRSVWGRIVEMVRGRSLDPAGPGDVPPAAEEAEKVHVADVHAVLELPPWWDTPEGQLPHEVELLNHLQRREPRLRERIDAAVKDRLGPGFEVRALAITQGSVEVLVPIFGALGTYDAVRSGLDYLVSDVRRILGREVRQHAGVAIDPDVWIVRSEGLAPAPEPPPDRASNVVIWLIGAGAFMTTTLGLIGATGANLERVRINYPVQISIAFSVVILAILVGVCWPLLRDAAFVGTRGPVILFALLFGAAAALAVGGSTTSAIAVGVLVALLLTAAWWGRKAGATHGQTVVLTALVLAVGMAVGAIAYWATRSLSAPTRPRIKATLMRSEGSAKLVGTVHASGLQRREHVLVRVIGTSSRADLAAARVGHARAGELRSNAQLVHGSRTGADQDGEATIELDVPVAAGLYDRLDIESEIVRDERKSEVAATDAAQVPLPEVQVESRCDRPTQVIGCLSVFVPAVAGGPRLTASWKLPAGRPPVLQLTARMGDLSSDDRVLLSVRRLTRKKGRLGGRVYSALWAADASGKIDGKVNLAVDHSRRPLCVIMRSLQGALNYASPEASHLGPCGKRSRGVAILVRPPAKE